MFSYELQLIKKTLMIVSYQTPSVIYLKKQKTFFILSFITPTADGATEQCVDLFQLG